MSQWFLASVKFLCFKANQGRLSKKKKRECGGRDQWEKVLEAQGRVHRLKRRADQLGLGKDRGTETRASPGTSGAKAHRCFFVRFFFLAAALMCFSLTYHPGHVFKFPRENLTSTAQSRVLYPLWTAR